MFVDTGYDKSEKNIFLVVKFFNSIVTLCNASQFRATLKKTYVNVSSGENSEAI
jgi:hypothetical protein